MSEPVEPPAPRPHILLISLDACRADHIGCYGHDRPTSPFIDQLAASGTRFADAFVNTHGTPPSHTTMLSSLYQESHGVQLAGAPPAGQIERIPAAVVMVQEILRGAGYITVGVSGGGNMNSAIGFGRGFVEYDDRAGRAPDQKHRLLTLIDRHHTTDAPLFMLFHTYEIHSPYAPPERWAAMFDTPGSDFEPTSPNLLKVVNTASRDLSNADLDHVKALYDGEIRFTDAVLRELFDQLRQRGLLDNILVILTADHGEEFADHGGMLHRGTLYDELLHVPLIMWGTHVPGGVVDDHLVSTVDIVPTILAAAQASPPIPLAGRDLLPTRPGAATGPDDANREFVFAQYGRELYAVRGHRWKLIQRAATGHDELYDLDRDPAERDNVIGDEPAVAADLRSRIAAWRAGLSTEVAPPTARLSAEQRKHLEALGYVTEE